MKTIYLLRHAKSEWADPGLKDHDRPLNERGRKAAPQMGAYIKAKKYRPDVVLCSTALRTVETYDAMKDVFGSSTPVVFEEQLYLAEAQQLFARLRWLDDDVASAMIIGHNPGIAELAQRLTASPKTAEEEKLAKRMRDKFSTAALAVIKLPIDTWRDVKDGQGRLADFMRPKDL